MRSGEKKRKYIFFDEMEFMTPFVGIKLRGPNKIKREREDGSEQDSSDETKLRDISKIKRPARYEDSSNDFEDETDLIQEHFDAMANSNDEEEDGEHGDKGSSIKSKAKQLSTFKASTPKQKLTKEQERIIKSFDVIRPPIPRKIVSLAPKTNSATTMAASKAAGGTKQVVAATGNPNRLSLRFFDMRDSDISFCMSMVSTFRKMGEQKKLRAKIDMLKVLHKYADNLDETPKAKVKISQQQPRNRIDVSNNEQSTEEEVSQHLEDHSHENGAQVKYEAKVNEDGTNNVWWT